MPDAKQKIRKPPQEKTSPAIKSNPPQPVKKLQFPLVLAGLAILLAIIAVILIGLAWKQQDMHYTKLQVRLNQARDQLHTLQNQFQRAQALAQHSAQQQTEKLQQLTQSLQQVAQTKAPSSEFLTLSEVNHLLHLANLNLHFNRDINSTIILLQSALKKLQHQPDPNLLKLRQAIANEIAALKAVPQINLSSLLIQLNALATQAVKLPLMMPTTVNAAPAHATPGVTGPARLSGPEQTHTWRQALAQSLQTLEKIIIVRRHDKTVQPLLSLQETAILQNNLQMLFRQAQWALIQRKPEIYQASLQQARDQIKRYFTSAPHITQPNSTQSILMQIQMLLKININPTLPDITASQKIVQQLLRQVTQPTLKGKKS